MRKYLEYISYLVRHKWFVAIECFRLKLYWLGIVHDWSKILPDEFFPYARHDWASERDETGYYKAGFTSDEAFDYAWLLHQKRNKHHWQWWILPEDNDRIRLLEMPEKYVKEMICDWRGAGRAQHNPTSCWKWYQHNKNKMQLHPETRKLVEKLLKDKK